MILHEIEVPSQIRHDNTPARPLRDYGKKDKVNVIITNPPLGGIEEDGIENKFRVGATSYRAASCGRTSFGISRDGADQSIDARCNTEQGYWDDGPRDQ